MACSMDRPGPPAAILAPDGQKSLGELLVELVNRAKPDGGYLSLSMILGGGGVSEATLVCQGVRVVAACATTPRGEVRGDAALEAIRGAAGERPSWGLMEAYKPGPDWVDRFLQVYRDARVSRTRSVYWAAGYEEEAEDSEEPGRPSEGMGETRLAMASISDPGLFMARVVLSSKIIRYTRARRPEDLHREAKDLSSREPDALYRLAIALKDGSTVNVFYMGGRPCLALYLEPDMVTARSMGGGDIIELLAGIEQARIEHVSLQKVECPDCVEAIREQCLRLPERREERSPAPRPEPRERREAGREAQEPVGEEARVERRRRRWMFWRR